MLRLTREGGEGGGDGGRHRSAGGIDYEMYIYICEVQELSRDAINAHSGLLLGPTH